MKTSISVLLAQKNSTVHTVPITASAQDAAVAMTLHNIGCVLVTDGGRVVGIFTERDVLNRIVARGLNPSATPVSQVMSPLLHTVDPSCSLDSAMAIVTEKRTRHLPVLEEGRVVGLISIGDINKWVVERLEFETESLRSYITGGYPN
jgi:CBS domain-containing protein